MGKQNIWDTKEWREAIKEWKEGKRGNKKDKCEQCGSVGNLTPHHEIPLRVLLFFKLRKLAITKMSKEQGFSFYPSAINKTGGFSTSEGYIKVRVLGEYMKKNPELKEEANKFAIEEYLKLNDTRTLCNRCHYAKEKGMDLCPYCKKAYKRTSYSSCFNCKEKADEDYAKFEKEIDKAESEMFKEFI